MSRNLGFIRANQYYWFYNWLGADSSCGNKTAWLFMHYFIKKHFYLLYNVVHSHRIHSISLVYCLINGLNNWHFHGIFIPVWSITPWSHCFPGQLHWSSIMQPSGKEKEKHFSYDANCKGKRKTKQPILLIIYKE